MLTIWERLLGHPLISSIFSFAAVSGKRQKYRQINLQKETSWQISLVVSLKCSMSFLSLSRTDFWPLMWKLDPAWATVRQGLLGCDCFGAFLRVTECSPPCIPAGPATPPPHHGSWNRAVRSLLTTAHTTTMTATCLQESLYLLRCGKNVWGMCKMSGE